VLWYLELSLGPLLCSKRQPFFNSPLKENPNLAPCIQTVFQLLDIHMLSILNSFFFFTKKIGWPQNRKTTLGEPSEESREVIFG